ncbi:hypothetical protein Gpo141_00011194 [Globisporangium polare]
MPLSPLSARVDSDHNPPTQKVNDTGYAEGAKIYEPRESVPWNPAWLPESTTDQANAKAAESLLLAAGAMGASPSTKFGNMTLESWLQSYEQDFLLYESLEKFIQVKLPEALAFCDKIEQQSCSAPTAGGLGDPSSAGTPGSGQSPSSRFHVRLRIAVYAHLVERTVFALAQSAALSHAKKVLFQARQEIFRAMFADYDKKSSADGASPDAEDDQQRGHASRGRRRRRSNDSQPRGTDSDRPDTTTEDRDSGSDRDGSEDSDNDRASKPIKKSSRGTSSLYGPTAAPRTLAFFLTKVPYTLKLREDTQRRALRFKRNQVVLRRIVQSLYRSLGSVFHAWKLLVRHKKEERLNNKGAQLTAMVVQQRGLVRSVFVEWSKATLRSKIKEMKANELEMKQQHEQVLADLNREIFLLREKNYELQLELLENQRYRPVSRKPKPAISVQVPTRSVVPGLEDSPIDDGERASEPSSALEDDTSLTSSEERETTAVESND